MLLIFLSILESGYLKVKNSLDDLLVFTSTTDAVDELMELFPDIHIKPNKKNAILISSVYDTHTEVIKTIIDKLSDIVDIYM